MGVLKKIILLLTMASPSFAMVNLQTASFIYKVNVLKDVMPLNIIYRSRTQHSGLFGFGWCSILENKITFLPNQKMLITDCSKDYDPVLDKLQREDNYYIYNSEKIKYYFTLKGKLHKFIIADKLWKIQHIDAFRIKLIIGVNSLLLQLNINKQVSVVSKKNIKIAKFTYMGNNLQVVKSKLQDKSFTYDRYHNLVQLSGNRMIDVTYDLESDRVTHVNDSNGCQKSIQYNLRNISALKSCENGPLKKLELSL